MISRYRKSITALVVAVLGWVGNSYIPDGHITRAEWYLLALALAGALGVYAVANDPDPVPAAPADVPAIELTPAGSVPLGRDERGRWVAPGVTRFSGE